MISHVKATRFQQQPYAEQVADLVNAAYAAAEQGLWVAATDRVSADDIAGYIAAGELIEARDGDDLVGVARLQRLATGEGELGMLVADPGRRGRGIGRELITYAERWAVNLGLPTMQLELLVPRNGTHPVKQSLYEWYTRLGYRVVRRADLADDYPALVPRLATACDFLVLHKPL